MHRNVGYSRGLKWKGRVWKGREGLKPFPFFDFVKTKGTGPHSSVEDRMVMSSERKGKERALKNG